VPVCTNVVTTGDDEMTEENSSRIIFLIGCAAFPLTSIYIGLTINVILGFGALICIECVVMGLMAMLAPANYIELV
jgi:hypothetical protein